VSDRPVSVEELARVLAEVSGSDATGWSWEEGTQHWRETYLKEAQELLGRFRITRAEG
jgi:hypothetical protein